MSSAPHDQTRGDSTPFLNEGQAACLSDNEVMALCMKAARGAGMSWGLAEEAGYSAVWLVQHGLRGPEYLYAYLSQVQEFPQAVPPVISQGRWRTPKGKSLCPVALGAALCDYMHLPEGAVTDAGIEIGRIDHPVLIIPFLAVVSDCMGLLLDLEWEGGSICIGGDADAFSNEIKSLDGPQQSFVLKGRPGTPRAARQTHAPNTRADTITALSALALRTTVPPSEASRAGAGASSSDND